MARNFRLAHVFQGNIILIFQEDSHEDREIHDLQHEIVIWHRTSQGLSNFSKVRIFKTCDQTRPPFVYFRPFLNTITNIVQNLTV